MKGNYILLHVRGLGCKNYTNKSLARLVCYVSSSTFFSWIRPPKLAHLLSFSPRCLDFSYYSQLALILLLNFSLSLLYLYRIGNQRILYLYQCTTVVKYNLMSLLKISFSIYATCSSMNHPFDSLQYAQQKILTVHLEQQLVGLVLVRSKYTERQICLFVFFFFGVCLNHILWKISNPFHFCKLIVRAHVPNLYDIF